MRETGAIVATSSDRLNLRAPFAQNSCIIKKDDSTFLFFGTLFKLYSFAVVEIVGNRSWAERADELRFERQTLLSRYYSLTDLF